MNFLSETIGRMAYQVMKIVNQCNEANESLDLGKTKITLNFNDFLLIALSTF